MDISWVFSVAVFSNVSISNIMSDSLKINQGFPSSTWVTTIGWQFIPLALNPFQDMDVHHINDTLNRIEIILNLKHWSSTERHVCTH